MASDPLIPDGGAAADKRYFPRWEVPNRVIYKLRDDPTPRHGHTRDLSCAGSCLFLTEHLPLREKLSLSIHLSPKTSVDVHGTVVWQDISSTPYLTGVAFYETDDKAQDLILRHAFELNHDQVLAHWYKGWEGRT
ncbi:MAG: PilZ domain-containing protein [Candidatus Omnitrophica bacterium]|nr:PilZ domain-containing protein [Candidatus Omnitrophota bacterium]